LKNIFIGLFALVAFAATVAYAQPNNTQTINLVVPAVLRVDISPVSVTLDLGTVTPTPGTDLVGPVTDGSSTYRYVHNSATDAIVSVGIGSGLPAGMSLGATLTAPAGATGSTVDLTGGGTVDAVSGLDRGAGSGTVTYSFSASAFLADPGTVTRTVTYTLHN